MSRLSCSLCAFYTHEPLTDVPKPPGSNMPNRSGGYCSRREPRDLVDATDWCEGWKRGNL